MAHPTCFSSDWESDRYQLKERRKLDILSRYDPPGTTFDQVRSRHAQMRERTWRAANLRRIKKRRDKERETKLALNAHAGCLDPSRGYYRWTLLIFVSFVSCGIWMQYDSVGALGDQFRNHTGPGITLTESQIGILDAVYSIPNTVLVLFGGILIDRLGLRFALILFLSIVTLGAVLMNVALLANSFPAMVVSRIVFGLGGESGYVAQDAFTSHWFEGRDLAFALAITTVVGRASDIATFVGFPFLDPKTGMYVVTVVCVVSLICTLATAWMDKRAETYSNETDDEQHVLEEYSFRGILRFSGAYWMAALLVMVFYSSIQPFMNLAPKFLEATYNIPREQSGYYVAIISAVSIIVSPILGLTLDRWGYRIYLIQIGLVSMIIAYFLLLVPQVPTPVPSLILLGLSFSIIPAALWPCLVILVPSSLFGTAYGVMQCLINIGNTGVYYGLSNLLEADNYFAALVIMMSMSCGGFLISIAWLTRDLASGNWCNLPTQAVVRDNKDEIPEGAEERVFEKRSDENEHGRSVSDVQLGERARLILNDSFSRDLYE